MVKKGDIIETEKGQIGVVSDILVSTDNRYVILFKDKGCPHFLIEGDDIYKVVKRKKK